MKISCDSVPKFYSRSNQIQVMEDQQRYTLRAKTLSCIILFIMNIHLIMLLAKKTILLVPQLVLTLTPEPEKPI